MRESTSTGYNRDFIMAGYVLNSNWRTELVELYLPLTCREREPGLWTWALAHVHLYVRAGNLDTLTTHDLSRERGSALNCEALKSGPVKVVV